MRIWSEKLIPVLLNKQLKAMRYELGDMIKQYPNIKHPLVKFADNYDIVILYNYFRCVLNEFDKRNINHNKSYDENIYNIALNKTNWLDIPNKDNRLIFDEDNEEYLIICRWNLYEKHLRGIITDEEWQKIEDLFKEEI